MGIFASRSTLWSRYRAQLQFRDKLMGGVPHDPKLIEGWLRSKAGMDEGELRAVLIRTLQEVGTPIEEDMTLEDMEKASAKVAGTKETTGFKRDNHGLYIESRQIKAGLKETTNILYAGDKDWLKNEKNPTRKGAKPFVAERVFVSPDRIYLDRIEPDGVEMIVGHVTGPQGPRSTLGYHEYATQPLITFDVLVAKDCIPDDWWPDMWTHQEENGIGALRSQGHGRFDIIAWDKVGLTDSSIANKLLASVNS